MASTAQKDEAAQDTAQDANGAATELLFVQRPTTTRDSSANPALVDAFASAFTEGKLKDTFAQMPTDYPDQKSAQNAAALYRDAVNAKLGHRDDDRKRLRSSVWPVGEGDAKRFVFGLTERPAAGS